jgi:hypothetical protein
MPRDNYNENQEVDSHRCDTDINYDAEEITIGIKQENELTQILTGECDVCGRELQIHISIDIEMMQIIDEKSDAVLYEY